MDTKQKIKVLESTEYPESLIQSWEKAYPDFKYRYPERFQWLHLKNPLRSVLGSSLMYIEVNGVCAAWTSAIYHYLNLDKRILMASFGADTFCLPEFRGKGFASDLQKKNTEMVLCWWGISLSPANRRIFLKIGFFEGEPLFYYFRVLKGLSKRHFFSSGRSILNRKKKLTKWLFTNPFSLRFFYFLLNIFLKSNSHKTKLPTGIKLKEIKEFNRITDKVWEKVKEDFILSVDRNKEYLNWRYNDVPFVKYKKYLIEKEDKAVGFFVYRVANELQDYEAYLTEFVLEKEYFFLAPMVMRQIEDMVKADGGRVLFVAGSTPDYKELFESTGFIKFRVDVPIIHLSGSLKEKINANSIIENESSWFMSLGDHDLEEYSPRMMQPDYLSLINILKNKLKFF